MKNEFSVHIVQKTGTLECKLSRNEMKVRCKQWWCTVSHWLQVDCESHSQSSLMTITQLCLSSNISYHQIFTNQQCANNAVNKAPNYICAAR